MTITARGVLIEFDAGEWLVTVEDWAICDSIRLLATKRHESGRLEPLGVVFIDYCRECQLLARAVIRRECLPSILADWVEENREWWRCPCEVRDEAARVICEFLRKC